MEIFNYSKSNLFKRKRRLQVTAHKILTNIHLLKLLSKNAWRNYPLFCIWTFTNRNLRILNVREIHLSLAFRNPPWKTVTLIIYFIFDRSNENLCWRMTACKDGKHLYVMPQKLLSVCELISNSCLPLERSQEKRFLQTNIYFLFDRSN